MHVLHYDGSIDPIRGDCDRRSSRLLGFLSMTEALTRLEGIATPIHNNDITKTETEALTRLEGIATRSPPLTVLLVLRGRKH